MSPAATLSAYLNAILSGTQGDSFVSKRTSGQLMPAHDGRIMHFLHFASLSNASSVHSDILLSSRVRSPASLMLPTMFRSLVSSSMVHFITLPLAPMMKLDGRDA